MKKWIVLLMILCVVCCLALVACNGTASKPGTGNGNGSTGTGSEADKTIDTSGLTFADLTVDYDGQNHSITLSGTLPQGVSVAYTYNGSAANGVADVGSYTVVATLSGSGYKTATMQATLIINGADIDTSGLTFSNDAVDFNDQTHSITVSGTLPQGVSVSYTYDGKAASGVVDVGSHTVVATLSGRGYNTATMQATLVIRALTIDTSALTFDNLTVEYDSFPHAIEVSGNVPAGVVTTYTYNGESKDSVIDVGTYTVVAKLSGRGYNEATMTATLKITANEEMLYSAVLNGNVYFQNNLDSNRLYVYSGSSLSKVNNDQASYFTSDGSNLYYYSGSLFSQTIRSLNTSNSVSTVYDPGRATYLTTDGTYLYYSKANLIDIKSENGIYKVAIGSNDDATRISTDKANFLCYANGRIFYVNTSDGSKLYSVSVNGGSPIAHTSKKVSDVTQSNGTLFYTLHDTVDSTLYKMDTATYAQTQLCIDNAAYITVVGNTVYYVNKDLLTSNIYGKGIYKVSVNGGTPVKILDSTGNGYYSLSGDGNNLYYYKLNDKHFYRYALNTQTETDLMRNFTPVDNDSLSGAAVLAQYNGEIYYTNPLDNSSLYKYNPRTGVRYKVLSDCVSNVFFHGNTMYYSTHILTNYALWRLDMTTPGAVQEKISKKRYENLIFDGNYIYANNVGVNTNTIVRMDLDGQNETEIYNKKTVHTTVLYKDGNLFHFCIDPAIGYKYIYTHALSQAVDAHTDIGVKSDKFVMDSNYYYYYDHTSNKVCRCTKSGSGVTTLISNVTVTEMFLHNGIIYYTSTQSGSSGLFAYDISSGTKTKLSDKIGAGFIVYDNYLYFINTAITFSERPIYTATPNGGDGHLYRMNLSTKTVTKVA